MISTNVISSTYSFSSRRIQRSAISESDSQRASKRRFGSGHLVLLVGCLCSSTSVSPQCSDPLDLSRERKQYRLRECPLGFASRTGLGVDSKCGCSRQGHISSQSCSLHLLRADLPFRQDGSRNQSIVGQLQYQKHSCSGPLVSNLSITNPSYQISLLLATFGQGIEFDRSDSHLSCDGCLGEMQSRWKILASRISYAGLILGCLRCEQRPSRLWCSRSWSWSYSYFGR